MLCDLLQCESSQPKEEIHAVKIMKIRLNKALKKYCMELTLISKLTFLQVCPLEAFVVVVVFLLTHKNEIQSLQLYCLEYILFTAPPQPKILKAYFGALLSLK